MQSMGLSEFKGKCQRKANMGQVRFHNRNEATADGSHDACTGNSKFSSPTIERIFHLAIELLVLFLNTY